MFKGKDKEYRILGICGSKMPNEDVKSMMDSICRSAVDSGWKVMMFTTFCDLYSRSHETTGEASVYKVINTDIIDALVVLPGSINNNDVSASIIAAAKDGNIPVVTIDGHFDGVPSVMFDYVNAFERIIRHVVEDHHCRTVNFIAGFKDNDFSEARIDCFKRVLAENGIEFDERRLGYGDFWEEPTRRAMDCFVESGLPMPEAIICCNDSMAITVCQYLSEKGYAVPDDVIVTGFDGIELEKFYQPRLTTGCVDYSAVGARTMEIIGKVLAGDTVRDAVIPYRMQLGGSCGCNKTDSANACDKIIKLYERVDNSIWHEDFMFNFLRKATQCRDLSELADVMSTHGDYFEWFCLNTDLFSKTPDEARYHDLFTEKMNAFFVRRMENHTNTDIIFRLKIFCPILKIRLISLMCCISRRCILWTKFWVTPVRLSLLQRNLFTPTAEDISAIQSRYWKI
ncbi:MAG: LacI family DNA-binding transcriptional regulator [Oscillospiraceae bacterium]